MFSIFLAFIACEYIEITSENSDVLAGPIFVKFYTQDDPDSQSISDAFQAASDAFAKLPFGGVECTANPTICELYNTTLLPITYLITPGTPDGRRFVRPHTFHGFCDFIERHTQFKSNRPPSTVVELNTSNLRHYSNRSECAIIVYRDPDCSYCAAFEPELRTVAAAFVGEPNVSFGRLDCHIWSDVCVERNVELMPAVRLYRYGQETEYSQERSAAPLLEFINGHCNTERGIDGLLGDQAGIVWEASKLARAFAKAEDKIAVLKQLKKIPDAQYYVDAAELWIDGGLQQLEKEREICSNVLKAHERCLDYLDETKRKYNVFGEFLPPSELFEAL